MADKMTTAQFLLAKEALEAPLLKLLALHDDQMHVTMDMFEKIGDNVERREAALQQSAFLKLLQQLVKVRFPHAYNDLFDHSEEG